MVWQIIILYTIVENLKSVRNGKNFDGVLILCLGERTALPVQELRKVRDNIRFYGVVPDNFENKNGKPCLIILYELLDVVYL